NTRLQNQLEDVRIKAEKREDEIEELYTLQDDLEQYLRKNSLEIHGIPESAYKSTEDAVIHVAKTLYVVIGPEDIDISLKLHLTAAWLAHLLYNDKTKSKLYKRRTSLENIKLS
ncbi:unnamed protein product, partial [Porites evermanni]